MDKKPLSAHHIILGILGFALLMFLLAVLFTTSMSDVAKKQLKSIQKNDLNKAYSLTTKLYQDKVSLEKFTTYVNKYPILKTYDSLHFTNRKIDGISGYLSGILEDSNHHQMQIEYEFMKEDNHWRIQDIRLSETNELSDNTMDVADNSGASIQGILISDTADRNGFVDIEKPLIPKSASKVYVTVQIISPQSGNVISATLTNSTTHEKIGSTSVTISKPGDALKAFYFSKGLSDWTPGDYEITVTLPTGASQTVKFKIQ